MWQQGFSQGEEGLGFLQDVWNRDPTVHVFFNQSLQLFHSSAAFPLQHVKFTPEISKIVIVINMCISLIKSTQWNFKKNFTEIKQAGVYF